MRVNPQENSKRRVCEEGRGSSIYGKEKGGGALFMGSRRVGELYLWEEKGVGAQLMEVSMNFFLLFMNNNKNIQN